MMGGMNAMAGSGHMGYGGSMTQANDWNNNTGFSGMNSN